MTDEELSIKFDMFLGHIEIVNTKRWEGDTLILGGYSIHYDRNGVETHRTKDRPNCWLDFSECPNDKWIALL